MVAVLRGDAIDFPLFLHVLGAIVLFGAVASVALLSISALRIPQHGVLLRGIALVTTLAAVWPGFVAMFVAGFWVLDREGYDEDKPPGWALTGIGIAEGGLFLLIALTVLVWLSRRRPAATPWAAGLALLYLLALAVGWFAMTAKPGV
jgi:hypothetical protein